MSAATDDKPWPGQVTDRAKFASREYGARMKREMDQIGDPFVPDWETLVLAYETGYLRGSNDAHEDLLKDLVERRADAREAGRLESETERLEFETALLQRESAALQHANETQQQLLEVLKRENEALAHLKEALASETKATRELKQLEERLAVLEGRG